VKPDPNRSRPLADERCDLAWSEPLDVVQKHGLSLAARQNLERLANGVERCLAVRGGRLHDTGVEKDWIPAPKAHPREVQRDAVEPAAEPFGIPQPVKAEKGLKQRLLYDVLSVLGPEHAGGEQAHAVHVAVQQGLEGRAVTAERGRDELAVRPSVVHHSIVARRARIVTTA
jgi:hypothetical protein